jgi:chemotaxis methyl-accepting protein methylase
MGPKKLVNADIQKLLELMQAEHGRDISVYDIAFLAQTLDQRKAAIAAPDRGSYLAHLAANALEAEEFTQALSNSHSEFFRNSLTFGYLEQIVLPALMNRPGDPEIRIWSAGCAGGQEAYSLAMLLSELADRCGHRRGFRIFATDRSGAEVQGATRGIFDETALQNVRLRHLRAFFSRQNEAWVVVPELRDWIEFSEYDLLDEKTHCPPACIFGGFDLIFCANLLFYYRPEVRRRILNKLCQSLAPHGYFVTGEVERALVEPLKALKPLFLNAPIFQKNEG